MACQDGRLATAEWREPASSDRLPVHRSESPTGYSSAGCSSAEPASASPVTDNSSLIPIRRLALMRCRAGPVRRQRGCHLYFAHRVTFLSCADTAQVRKPYYDKFVQGVVGELVIFEKSWSRSRISLLTALLHKAQLLLICRGMLL